MTYETAFAFVLWEIFGRMSALVVLSHEVQDYL